MTIGLTRIVSAILKEQAARGNGASKKAVSSAVWGKIEQRGGPTKIGIGRAAITLGCLYYIGNEIQRQLKTKVTERDVKHLSSGGIPSELRRFLGHIPRWLTVDEGSDPVWVHWTNATVQHWQANAALKRKKANQSLASAQRSLAIANYMATKGIKRLGQVLEEREERDVAA